MGLYLPELIQSTYTGKTYLFAKNSMGVWTPYPTLTTYTGKTFKFQAGLFGNVLAGYLRLPSGTLITNGFRVIFKNSAGFAVMGKCYSTGVYQVVLDLQRYDKSYLFVGTTAIELYYQYGSFYADGYLNQMTAMDLFFLPSQEAHVIGFKKKRLFA